MPQLNVWEMLGKPLTEEELLQYQIAQSGPLPSVTPAPAPAPVPIPEQDQQIPMSRMIEDLGRSTSQRYNAGYDANRSIEALMKSYQSRAGIRQSEMDAGTEALEKEISNFRQNPTQLDLSPIASLVDTWTGSQMAQAYKAPMSPDQKRAQLIGLQKALQDQRDAASKNELAQLKAQIDAYQSMKENPLKEELMRSQIAANRASAGLKLDKEDQRVGEAFLKSDDAKKIKAQIEFETKLKNYKDLVRLHGNKLTGENRTVLDSAYNELGLIYKEAQNLGALTGPDWDIVKGSIAPQAGVSGLYRSAIGGGKEGILKGLSEIEKNSRISQQAASGSASVVFGQQMVDKYKKAISEAIKIKPNDVEKRIKELEAKARSGGE